ncbi:MAG: hypothetical protein GY856_48970 [bacterium]|nr:hypothetical protein [bacterium]
MSDGLGRGIDLPIPHVNQTVSTNFSAEQVSDVAVAARVPAPRCSRSSPATISMASR